jgi:hypothetical protein
MFTSISSNPRNVKFQMNNNKSLLSQCCVEITCKSLLDGELFRHDFWRPGPLVTAVAQMANLTDCRVRSIFGEKTNSPETVELT